MGKRWGALGVGVALAACLTVAKPAPAQAAQNYRYVVTDTWVAPAARLWWRSTPVGHLAPTGTFGFTAPGSEFTLRLDDTAALDGQTVRLDIWTRGGTFSGCIVDGTPMTFRGLGAGRVVVEVGSLYGNGGCTAPGSAGTVTVKL